MKQKIVFFDKEKPYLVFPAAALFLQLEGSVHIEPTTTTALSDVVLEPKDEIYVLDFATNLDNEGKLLSFQLSNQTHIRLWAGTSNEKPETCLPLLIQSGYHILDAWQKIALEVFQNDLQKCSPPAERIIRACKAQHALDFNLNHPSGTKKLLRKILNELISGDKNREIDALCDFQKAADEKLAAMLRFWSSVNLRHKDYRTYPFQKCPFFALEEGKEMDAFLDLSMLIKMFGANFSKNLSRFVLEYNCRGRVHYLLVSKDGISRHDYSDKVNTKYLRIKAAHKLL